MVYVKSKKIESLSTFNSLPQKQQTAIALLFSGNFKQTEIAEQLNVNSATVSVWKRREDFRQGQDEYNRFMLRDLAAKAVMTLSDLLGAKSEMVRYNAASYILDKGLVDKDLQAADLRRANAEADIAETRAKSMKQSGEGEPINIVIDIPDKGEIEPDG